MEDATDTGFAAESNRNPIPASAEAGPLVQVTFQKDPRRKRKYLESEPKALGCTQIVFAFFLINMGFLNPNPMRIMEIINGIFPIIAGGVAIAAQNLKLPTLKACLGLQVFTCITCWFTFLITTFTNGNASPYMYSCFYDDYNGTYHDRCVMLENIEQHYIAGVRVVLFTVIAISVTLAVYCCKVIQCCSPGSHVPVITVNAPQSPE